MFTYVLLDPRSNLDAFRANEAVFARGPVLGVEVTVPALAGRCVLGNVDPQHSGGDATRAAIEAALEWPVPPAAAVLATVRPDLDAFGAMAVLELRATAVELPGELPDRVRRIAEADRFARGPWPGARPLPDASAWGSSDGPGEPDLAPLAAAVADATLPVVERVELVRRWLLDGEVPQVYRALADRNAESLRSQLARGEATFGVRAGGRVATVEGTHPGLLALGYRLAPVVVARNPAFRFQGGPPHAKLTVAQYASGYVDLVAVRDELAAREPGWGGSPTIIGSPQGEASALSTNDVAVVVERHLLRDPP